MTGIEIFANLVAAYEGRRAERSRKAFGSLIIIMGTTAMTMIIVGPAIHELAQVSATGGGHGGAEASVFTQTMNALLPTWASYLGTIAGVAVLLSASAAAAQGVQNLALGLRYRHYVAASLGQRNKYDVAGKPVWIMIAIIAFCYAIFGTHEETYLALYAAGVFILLSMTGWAASKRLFRQLKQNYSTGTSFFFNRNNYRIITNLNCDTNYLPRTIYGRCLALLDFDSSLLWRFHILS